MTNDPKNSLILYRGIFKLNQTTEHYILLRVAMEAVRDFEVNI